jgi:predicted DNA binding CopG/RHH family protein|tara:strand:+ start:273 stop:509 length:237 start_codon:yes stop_codon:yes gene_type:complete
MDNNMNIGIESAILPDMAKAERDHQINIRVSEEDLQFIDAKARKYGMKRSAMMKYFALNAELSLTMQEEIQRLRKPQI